MGTLVVCIDRTGAVTRKTGIETPIAGWEAVQSLVVELGLADPEDSGVNCLLEGLRVTRELHDGEETATVAVVSGVADTVVGADRAVAAQVDRLVERYDPDSAVLVVDSAEDERLVPVVESRLRVDAVDRVVVRQAHDLQSTYYLLKQFLADEEMRRAILVPIGIVLLVFPALLALASPAAAVAAITAVIGLFLLYKGLGVDDYLADVPAQARDALYSGRVSIVTYVVAGGLALVGVFAGALGASGSSGAAPLIVSMAFAYDSVPWLALAALAASTGRLVDEVIRTDRVRSAYVNLPFGVVAMGFVVRGFAAYFLERSGDLDAMAVPPLVFGAISVEGFALSPEQHLALFVVIGVLVSVVGIRVSSYLSDSSAEIETVEPVD